MSSQMALEALLVISTISLSKPVDCSLVGESDFLDYPRATEPLLPVDEIQRLPVGPQVGEQASLGVLKLVQVKETALAHLRFQSSQLSIVPARSSRARARAWPSGMDRNSQPSFVAEKSGSRASPLRSTTSGSWPDVRSSAQRSEVRRHCQLI